MTEPTRNDSLVEVTEKARARALGTMVYTAPWWLVVMLVIGGAAWFLILFATERTFLVRLDDTRFFNVVEQQGQSIEREISVRQLRNLDGLRLGVVSGTQNATVLRDYLDSAAVVGTPDRPPAEFVGHTLTEYATFEASLNALLNDEVDAIMYERIPLLVYSGDRADQVRMLSAATQFPNPYFRAFLALRDGMLMTITIALSAYACAFVIGLVVGLIRAQPPTPLQGGTALQKFRSGVQLVAYNAVTVYVETLRGLPILVVLLIVAYVIFDPARDWVETTFSIDLGLDGTSPIIPVTALALTYGAFMSETFRAGIQSIERGQFEASRALGMNYLQAMRYVVLPQALRRILPPLGNDLVSIIKDSSLVAILGIGDIAQEAKLYSSATFRFAETYFVAAVLYLMMTFSGTMIVRWMERRFRIGGR
jgi:polar amino acid transport system permease protein